MFKRRINLLAMLLLILAGLSWGLIGFFHYDVFATFLRGYPTATRVIQVLFGLAAVYQVVQWNTISRR